EAEEQKGESAIFQRSQGEAEAPRAGEEEKGSKHLDQQVARRDRSLTAAATAAQDQPAENRDVVVGGNLFVAVGAGGTAGLKDRQVPGQAIDTHVQEAAENQPEDNTRQCQRRIHRCPYQNAFRCNGCALIIRGMPGWMAGTKVTVLLEGWRCN